MSNYKDLPRTQTLVLLVSILIVALCGIVYELIIGTVSSYLLGNSVYQFSLTIGFFMFAMGIGSYISRFIMDDLIQAFVWVEMILALVGGICSISLFLLFPAAPWFYTTAMFGFICFIGFLVGLEIPLLTRILSDQSSTRESIANVMSLDYLGALFGSVAFPLLLLPSLGLISSSFAIGLINGAVALLNVIWLRDYLRHPKAMLNAVLLVLVLLVLLSAYASKITSFAQDHLYFDRIVWREQSPYQSLVVTNQWESNDLRLFIDGHLQFSERDEYRYHEALVHPVLAWSGNVERVLVLGGGDGLAVREILKHQPVKSIHVIDLDPAMTDLGQRFAPVVKLNKNAMNSPKVTILNQDAFTYVQRSTEIYDRVIIDFPDPHNEALSKLYSTEFYAMLSARMSDDGVLIAQSSSPFFAVNTYWTIGRTMDEIFPLRTSFQISIPSFGLWGFHMAHKKAGGTLESFPTGLKSLSPDVFAAAQVFSKDIAMPAGLKPNSIFDPIIYHIYAKDLKAKNNL
ncbi:MAG: polyamine aminopropyltransferase [Marinosulfonomonas sp.]|nr:polyamine aminopropyltransferase [Marinosulfonomonas sp.]